MLVASFSLVGIPSVITSDNATYFTSQLYDKFMELFGCKPRFSTVLHQEGNSLVERMNASLKKMLAHVSQKYPKQWHKLLPIVLWCMRESRNETLGVSPFMMIMGCNPANPLKIRKDTWTGENQLLQTVGKSVSEFLAELQTQIQEIHDYAANHADVEQQRYTDQYNKRAVDKHFQIGQQVIVLIPDSTNKFLSRWQGPGTVVSEKSPYSYLVELQQGQCRWLHANKLRPYHARVNALIGNCAIVYESDEEFGTLPVITVIVIV